MIADRKALVPFAFRVVGIFFGLAIITAAAGIAVKSLAPGFDVATLQAIETHRNQALTSIAAIVSDAGSFALLAPLSIAFILLRRWKRPADDLALVVIAGGSALLPSLVKLVVARPRPTIEQLRHLVTLSFPSEHTTQAAAIYLTIAIMLSHGLQRGLREAVVVLAVLIAVAVAWSRVYLGVHYPTDVIAGLLLGWSWALLIYNWARPRLSAAQKDEAA
jgi:undecaprenyl-diphosphatase